MRSKKEKKINHNMYVKDSHIDIAIHSSCMAFKENPTSSMTCKN